MKFKSKFIGPIYVCFDILLDPRTWVKINCTLRANRRAKTGRRTGSEWMTSDKYLRGHYKCIAVDVGGTATEYLTGLGTLGLDGPGTGLLTS